jgi:hypothetical protein
MEGRTERVFLPVLKNFLAPRLIGKMPKLKPHIYDGRIPKDEKLRRVVENYLRGGVDAIIALTDVYTGTNDFETAADAKAKMRAWVGSHPNFYPHAAQYDFEAWLLPFWSTIQKLAGHQKGAPGGAPETINHDNPPSKRIAEIFEIGASRDSYVKPRDAKRILESNDLLVSAHACPELKAFLNTVLSLCGGETIS